MQGYIIHFSLEKGYGFIVSEEHEENIFVHISKVTNASKLSIGQKVKFDIEKTSRGLSALNVTAGSKQHSPYLIFGLISALAFFIMFLYASKYIALLFAYLLAINLTTFGLYGYDKFISSSDKLRVPEWNLQALAFLGGSPAGLLAQKFFRHKTIKGSFQIIYWVIVVVQVGLVFFIYK